MQTMTVEEFHAAVKGQGVLSREDFAFVCPMCATVQSANDLIAAGAGKSFEEVERYLAFSCFGRWTGAGAPRNKPDGGPCNWTLGGLFSLHKLEVVTPEGEQYPCFEIASPEQAQKHAQKHAAATESTHPRSDT